MSIYTFDNLQKWMGAIHDNVPLGRISIPGTHDSGTFELSNPVKVTWAKTQEKNFREQMNYGIRFFDIRGRLTNDDTIVLHHGNIYLYTTLRQFISTAQDFLKDNPSETIIMSLKKEYKDMPGASGSFEEIFEKYYFSDAFLKTEGNITLGQARGKIVLFRRYGNSQVTGGYRNFPWADNATFTSSTNGLTIKVQDEYNDSYYPKQKAIHNLAFEASQYSYDIDTIFINFISLASGGTAWSSPYYYASYLNQDTANYILTNYYDKFDHPHNPRAGWVIFDYVGDRWSPKLYETVISTNYLLID